MLPSLAVRYMVVTCLAVLAGMPSVANAQWFGPSTYEDCILKNMQGVTGDLAAATVRDACRKKFPVPSTRFSEMGNRLPDERNPPPGISYPNKESASWGLYYPCGYKTIYGLRYEADSNAMPFLSSDSSAAFGGKCIDAEDIAASNYVASRLRRVLDLVKLLRIEEATRPAAPSALNIVVQNGSPVMLSSLRIGITRSPGEPCTLNSADYTEVRWCDGYVDARASGSFSCSNVPDDPRQYCALGFKVQGYKSMLDWKAAVGGM